MKIQTDENVNLEVLKNDTVAIIGYGSQGRAHARNLHDSGFNVIVGVRENGPSWKQAQADGLNVATPEEAARKGRLIAMLVPDMAQEKLFEEAVRPGLKEGDTLLFAHGFTVYYDRIKPPANTDVVLIAPKGPGGLVRREFELGRGVPCLRAVYQDFTGKAADKALTYAHGIGGTRAGVLDTTFAEETETDLFGEQAVLCGGVTELILQGYETLTEAGYQPEVAYFECMHELKLIVDLLHEGGLARMHKFVSETAKYGDLVSGPRIINDETRARMRDVLKDIRNGVFAKNWVLENQTGKIQYHKLLEKDLSHSIETVGQKLRARMPWLDDKSNATKKRGSG
ncbi:MAG: ketol-acid reductoisomerase [Alphaproteobacteria bacterium]|nr:ketol-acid reductoisomerase [Alphaproteobacteria bacterium]